ncbi:hypothetical protein EJ110_NYTH26898 [Nymphaea thermarum]|nr:hypothetical protein EJ110_NYTH26898 [Nymphaea thermarum]
MEFSTWHPPETSKCHEHGHKGHRCKNPFLGGTDEAHGVKMVNRQAVVALGPLELELAMPVKGSSHPTLPLTRMKMENSGITTNRVYVCSSLFDNIGDLKLESPISVHKSCMALHSSALKVHRSRSIIARQPRIPKSLLNCVGHLATNPSASMFWVVDI